MQKTIQSGMFCVILIVITSGISCVMQQETEIRTPEMEKNEIDNIIGKLETEGYNVDTTELGVYYVIYEEGTGPFPQAGDTCYLEYVGYFSNGTIFDASQDSYANAIWEFIFKDQSLIPGFEDGISLMNKGTELDMIIPSGLAYGPYGYGIIPAYTPLLFSAKMHDLGVNEKNE